MAQHQNLPKKSSVINYKNGGRLNAPSAVRNAIPIIQLVRKTVTKPGNALEIASGTGQHIVKLASALPFLPILPTWVVPCATLDPSKVASIISAADI